MKIVKIIKKKKSMYEVVLDTQKSLILLESVMIHHEVFFKKMLTEKEIENIQKDNEIEISYQKCCHYLDRKMRTEKEVRTYLKKDEIPKEIMEEVIQRLEKNSFLDDNKYVKCYVNDSVNLKCDGPMKIEKSLVNLGIAKEQIENDLHQIPFEVWEEKIKNILQKKIERNRKDSEMVFKRKLSQYFYSLGYPYEMTSPFISKVHLENQQELGRKREESIRKKLSRKYSGEELEIQIKRKLYQMGFKD